MDNPHDMNDEVKDQGLGVSQCGHESEMVRENAQLRQKVLELEGQLLRAKQVITRLESLHFKSPPVEILRIIFEWVLPPSILLDSSLSLGPHSSWSQAIRTKKNIMGVCWQWYKIGLELLYAEVTIRRIGQISALLRTLVANPHFGIMIKHLGVNCFVPRAYSAVFKIMLGRLVSLCPRLTKLDFLPQIHLSHNPSPLPISLSSVLGNITHLQCDTSVEFNNLAPELTHLSRTLVSLSICITPHDTAPINVKLILPRLQYLEIRCLGVGSLENLRSMLDIPALTHLTIMSNRWAELSFPDKILQYCIVHGSGLRYLHIHCLGGGVPGLQLILDQCPNLEHVVANFGDTHMCSHPNIRYIDLWVEVSQYFPEYESGPETRIDWAHFQDDDHLVEVVAQRNNFPNLQLIRELDISLVHALHLPIVLPPSVVDHDTYELEYLGLFILYAKGRLLRIDGCCWDVQQPKEDSDYAENDLVSESESVSEGDSNPESNSNPESDPESHDSVSDTDSDSSWKSDPHSDNDSESDSETSWESDGSRGLTDEFYGGDEWEADPDTFSVYADVLENR